MSEVDALIDHQADLQQQVDRLGIANAALAGAVIGLWIVTVYAVYRLRILERMPDAI